MASDGLPTIDVVATAENICRLMKERRLTVGQLQMMFGFQSATNIYSWRQGRFIPSSDHLVALAYIFDCKIEDILVVKEGKK